MSSYHTLFEIGKVLLAETDLNKLLPVLMDKVIEQTQAQRGIITVRGAGGELLFETARHFDKKDIARPEFEISKTIIQSVLQSGQYVVIPNALDSPQLADSSSIAQLRLLSVACAPLRHEQEVFGAIYIDNRDVAAIFNEQTGKLLNEFSELIAVAVKNALERRQKDLKLKRQSERRRQLEEQLARSEGYGELRGLKSLTMLEVCNQIEKVARTNSPVLIMGETGTGKELIARELHRKGGRHDQPIVTLNCAGLPHEDLMISELFGHVKGAFTGADKDKEGYFETADGGTIFLDEIGKSSLKFQAKLLRVLESGEFNRLGETAKLRQTDVRILSAASPNLMELMQKGEFYPDLYYRLESFVIRVPPLRERREDIGEIAGHFLKKFAETYQKNAGDFSAEARELLKNYDWPGNVRELRNVVNRAVVLAEGEVIYADDLDLRLPAPTVPSSLPSAEMSFNVQKQKMIAGFEQDFIAKILRETKGNISEAARRTGMYKKNLIDKMKQYGIKREDFA